MPKCYSSKPNDGKPADTKFPFSYDDEVEKNNKTMLLVGIKDLDFDDAELGYDMRGSNVGVGASIDADIKGFVVGNGVSVDVDVMVLFLVMVLVFMWVILLLVIVLKLKHMLILMLVWVLLWVMLLLIYVVIVRMMKRKKIKTISLLIRNDLTTYWVIITLRKLYIVLQIQNINEY